MANPAPACGDYFAEDRYLAADPEAGLLRNPAGTPILVLPRDLLDSLREAISAEFGPKADRVFAAAGRKWGEAFAARFQRELSEYYGAPLGEWPFARLETCIVSALDRLGWGRAELDTTRFGQGVFVMKVCESFAKEALTAGMLGGLFSALAGQDLDAVATGNDHGASTFVIALRERIERLTTTSQDAVVAELATIRA